jgi:hypothetical protein
VYDLLVSAGAGVQLVDEYFKGESEDLGEDDQFLRQYILNKVHAEGGGTGMLQDM